jgi:hypothetical protein
VDDRRWEKLAAATGVAFVALILASSFVVPKMPPKIDDSIGTIGRFYVDHHSGLLWGSFLAGLSTLFGLWFFGTVAAWIRRQGQPRLASILFGGSIAAISIASVGGLCSTLLAYRADGSGQASPATVQLLSDGSLMAFTFVWIPIAVFVAATSMAGMRSSALPQWLWGSGAVYAVVAVIGSAGVFAHDGFFAPGGGLSFILFLAFAVWVLSLSLVLWQKVGAGDGATATAGERPMAMTS